jgi:hypothetical protein
MYRKCTMCPATRHQSNEATGVRAVRAVQFLYITPTTSATYQPAYGICCQQLTQSTLAGLILKLLVK